MKHIFTYSFNLNFQKLFSVISGDRKEATLICFPDQILLGARAQDLPGVAPQRQNDSLWVRVHGPGPALHAALCCRQVRIAETDQLT